MRGKFPELRREVRRSRVVGGPRPAGVWGANVDEEVTDPGVLADPDELLDGVDAAGDARSLIHESRSPPPRLPTLPGEGELKAPIDCCHPDPDDDDDGDSPTFLLWRAAC